MKILFASLGCDKNLVDTEVMLGYLYEKGYSFTDNEEEADIVVVNTCGFIHDAKEESVQTILEMAELKKEGKIKALLVTGCLAQRYKEEIQTEIEEVDAILGTTAIDHIVEAVEEALGGNGMNHLDDINKIPPLDQKRILTTGGHFAYLKIAEGCNKKCTYCAIPKMRGKYRSVPIDNLVQEAQSLVERGTKELILVAQETTVYGIDIYGKKELPKLLRQLCKIEGLEWIRILYCYPEEITEELIAVMKEEDKICNYLDIPIQHASNRILQLMGRRTNQEQLRHNITMMREAIPDMCLRTTFITGFPDETEEDHQEVLAFIDEMEFDRLGVFTYSREEDTIAGEMEEQIEEGIKVERQEEIMELQQEIAFEKAELTIGTRLTAMIEGKLEEDGVYLARTYKDAPNVDGFLFLHTQNTLMTGDFVQVIITGSHEYDLIGELIDESSQ
ncbi:MAG: 30S ribosomal protein S12 methylthiotransferase RimO [Eubacteriales bacterium]